MRYNPPCVCGRSSSGRARPCQGRGSEFEPRRPLQKETPSVRMVFSFWNAAGRFELTASTCAKRVKSRGEAGFLRMAMPFAGCREASSSLVARSKKKHHPSGWCFLFGMPRAGLNSLPRPARSASNQEVRQGSCEWLCHSRDAGKRVRASSSTAPAPCFCPVIPSQ